MYSLADGLQLPDVKLHITSASIFTSGWESTGWESTPGGNSLSASASMFTSGCKSTSGCKFPSSSSPASGCELASWCKLAFWCEYFPGVTLLPDMNLHPDVTLSTLYLAFFLAKLSPLKLHQGCVGPTWDPPTWKTHLIVKMTKIPLVP